MSTTANHNDLLKLPGMFREGIDVLGEIKRLLDQEREAVTSNDLKQLESVIADKKAAVIQFAQCQANWSQLISGHATSADGFFDCLPEQARALLRPHWEQLETALQAVQDANERNGQIIGMRNRQVTQLLSALQGHRPASQLYTDGGSRNNYGAQSRIGKA